jgi:hypothetical protein
MSATVRNGNGSNTTTGGNQRGGRGPKRVTMVPVELFREALRDVPNRKMRRIAAKFGITPAPAVQS